MGNNIFKVTWVPQLEQDFDALVTKGSVVYDKELTENLIKNYGSIELFKKSTQYKILIQGAYGR